MRKYSIKKWTSLFFVVTVLISSPGQGQLEMIQQPDGKKISLSSIDSLVKTEMDKGVVTGLCIGILNDNKPANIKAYGYRNKEEKILNDTATCFYAASLAKPLFACIVMQLVDEKLIDLDVDIVFDVLNLDALNPGDVSAGPTSYGGHHHGPD